jgi:hypothetical protein
LIFSIIEVKSPDSRPRHERRLFTYPA